MKKTLVALAVAATAATAVSTANAATVYEQDGTKVELSGSFRMFLGRLSNDERGDLVNDDSRIILKASQDLGNGLSGFAGYEIRFNDNSDSKSSFNDPTTNKLYGGFSHKDIGALSFGRQATNSDDVLQDNGYYNSGEFGPLKTSGEKVVKFRSAEWNGFSFGLDYLFGDSNKDLTAETYKNGYGAALFYNYAINDNQALDFAAAYNQNNFEKPQNVIDNTDKDQRWLVHAGYTYGPLNVGLNYGQTRTKFIDSDDEKVRYSLVQASYQIVEPSRVYVQWEREDTREDQVLNKYLVGVDYKLHKNVLTYVQYAHKRIKEYTDADPVTTKDHEYGVGLRVFF
ncbi:porin [Lonepinella sp. MS14437]|uniref:porin n=1 Tax=Lonepinella sp. MS14437 TaxID=3003620 RepID=UPI0036D884D5